MQCGQALSEYWPTIGGSSCVVFVGAGLMLGPWLGDTYQRIVDSLFGPPETVEMVCVPEEDVSYSPSEAYAGAHHFVVEGWVYDEDSNTTTVAYRVTSGRRPAISHWTLELPVCIDDSWVVYTSEGYEFVESDPTTGARGLKFDTGYRDNETRLITIVFQGRLENTTSVVTVKAGREITTGTIQGVGCESESTCE